MGNYSSLLLVALLPYPVFWDGVGLLEMKGVDL